jgi:hypothetical protein
MDSIWNCAFGLDINCQNEFENLFLQNGIRHFQNLAEYKLLHLVNRNYFLIEFFFILPRLH